jgi:pimeloyl-ACP methyl ester carboxylesterase
MTTIGWKLTRRVAVSGGEVAYDVFGDGPPVILVHGAPASSFLWRNVAPALAKHHTVYVWDLLGFGDSTLGPDATPSIAQQARTLTELAAHWGLEAPALVGHDIGGGIVTRAHLVERLPVRRLVLLDAAVIGPWNTTFTEHMQQYAEAYRTMPPHVFADLIAPRLRTATHKPLAEEVLARYLAPWQGAPGQQRWVDQVVAVDHADTAQAVSRLDDVAVPTLVLWGEHDAWLTPEVGDRLATAIPGAIREAVADAGHFAPEDNPEDIADALLRFL